MLSIVSLFVFYGLLWLILTEASLASWLFGAITALLAALIHKKFHISGNQHRLSLAHLSALVHLVGYFIWESLKGGIYTARLAFQSQPCASEYLFHYYTELRSERANFFFVQMISLMPGTLGVTIRENHVLVHALDPKIANPQTLYASEKVVQAFFQEGSHA
ncbi:Na+/H+ antiporter subunit E [Salinimonas chungwhensis]|uniref:Na+/H+ antiporter subunit E n=1 Tax=Salinimonas chungwhensis TaxID=265425 RepID=UPI0003663649|nr:Na+/H+ antiporter subunit E [Salinimonas chungwhensis]